MTSPNGSILAGTQGSGGGAQLAFFAPPGTPGPTGAAGTAGVQSMAITGAPTGGTFTLTYRGATTAPIAYNATAAAVVTALNALTTLSGVTASGGPLPTSVVVTIPSTNAPSTLTGNAANLVGGGAVTVNVTTPGVQGGDPSSVAFDPAFRSAGVVSDTGLVGKVNESSKEIYGYGSTAVLRTLVSQRATSFDLTFLYSNPVSLALYHRKPLGSIVPNAAGAFTIATGGAALPHYTAIFDIVDGADHIRAFCPDIAISAVQGVTAAPGSAFEYGVTVVTYPDNAGNAIYWNYLVNALAGS